jgi:hypothetical protein
MYGKIEKLNSIWDGKKLLIVEGAACKTGINTDLLYAASHIERVLVPGKNAFDKRQEIINEVIRHKDIDLVLLVCGPTATVLAHDLYQLGYWAIDFGQGQGSYIDKAKLFDGYRHKTLNETDYKNQIVATIE